MSCATDGCPHKASRGELFCAECGRDVYGTATILGPLVDGITDDQPDLFGTTLAPVPCSVCRTPGAPWRPRRRAHVCAACEVGA